jgi:hypothetical protein
VELVFLRKNARWPVSRVLSLGKTPLDGHSSRTFVAERLTRPTRAAGWKPACTVETAQLPLFGLAPGGVYRAAPVTSCAVRSYRTLSPLPAKAGGLLSVALSLGSPPPGVTRHPVSMEPGLSSPNRSWQRPSDHLAKAF